MLIRKAEVKDLDEVVKIHLARFKNFFLSSLGVDFLLTFYMSFLKQKNAIILVCIVEGVVVGFAAGTIDSRGFMKQLVLSSIPRYLLSLTKIFLSNPLKLLEIFKRQNKKREDDKGEYAELISIATIENTSGFGAQLLRKFEEEVTDRSDFDSLSLTTDAENNNKTLSYYYRNGYGVMYPFLHNEKRKMYRLIKNLEK